MPVRLSQHSVVMRRCTTLLMMWFALIVWIAAALPASSATRHVVMLFDERLEFPGLAALEAEFVRALASNSPDRIETYRETMDLSRFDSNTYQTLLKDYLRQKYANKKIDVAVAFFGPAFEFLLNHGDAIFPGARIVFSGLDKRRIDVRSLPPNIRGVFLKREFSPTLDLALGLHPQAKRVVVVAGQSEFDTRLLDQAKQQFSIYENRLAFTYLTTRPMQKLLTELAGLPPQTIVLFITLFQDGAGESFIPHEVVTRVSAAATVPTYGFLDQYLGRGIVGGSLYDTSTLGIEAAKLVLLILTGSGGSEPSFLEASGNKMLFDWRQMQRWGISESRLPPGSEILFRNPTVWEQYRASILAVIAAFLIQAGLISWLFYEHWARRRAEIAARNTMSELTHMNRLATAGQLSASIAHEVNQPLAGIVVSAHAALRWLSPGSLNVAEAREGLNRITSAALQAGDIVKNVRAMFRHDVREATLVDTNTVILSVLALLRNDLLKQQIELQTQLDDRIPQVVGIQVELQQVILNLVMNAIEAMHSVPHRVMRIQSELSKANTVHVSIEDNGTGIDPSNLDRIFQPLFTTKTRGMGVGLSICQSIIEGHKGHIWVSPGSERGSIFQFELPMTFERGLVRYLDPSPSMQPAPGHLAAVD